MCQWHKRLVGRLIPGSTVRYLALRKDVYGCWQTGYEEVIVTLRNPAKEKDSRMTNTWSKRLSRSGTSMANAGFVPESSSRGMCTAAGKSRNFMCVKREGTTAACQPVLKTGMLGKPWGFDTSTFRMGVYSVSSSGGDCKSLA